MQKNTLSPHLDGHYTLRGIEPTSVMLPDSLGRKLVDFRTITLAQAKALHDAGCKYLVPSVKKVAEKQTKE